MNQTTTPKQDEKKQEDEKCSCLEYIGDNPTCPKHGHLYRTHAEKERAQK